MKCLDCSTTESSRWKTIKIHIRCTTCYSKWYKLQNIDIEKARNQKWYSDNNEKAKKQSKEWKENNKDKVKELNKNWCNKKYVENGDYKIRCILRARLRAVIKNNQKAGSAIDDLGCSIEEFKKHIESKFEPWMNWNNHGSYDANRKTWQLDHINALANVDLTNRDEFLKVAHYSNMQPLLSLDNIKKGNRYDIK